jgi:polysaccharide pyruvyl transferase WcaK-like protein
VPVFALSYSIKARGIAKDLFGKELCVQSIKSIQSADDLFNCLQMLEKDAEKMHEVLNRVIPEKKALAFSAGEALKEII